MSMRQALHAVHGFLTDAYASLPGMTLAGMFAADCTTQAAWYLVDDDLMVVDDDDAATGALLLDPEIGLCLYLLPFAGDSRIEVAMARGLALRSRLLSESAGQADVHDPHGPWHVAIHWLLVAADEKAWLKQAATLRNDTAHIEEIPIDYISCADGDWTEACVSHGLPRLLLATRALLRRDSGQVEQWANADLTVRDALARLDVGWYTPRERAIGDELRDWLAGQAGAPPAVGLPLSAPERLGEISVKNLRNIRALSLDLSGDGASARVVQGPNGTGKSNLFEAISLALCGASRRYLDFLQDADLPPQRKDHKYRTGYLSPISEQASTSITWRSSSGPSEFALAPEKDAAERLRTLDGTLLAQDESRAFLTMGTERLGALALGDYSGLASRVNDYLDQRARAAGEDKNAALRRWGLSTSITRLETATDQIAGKRLADELARPSHPLDWLAGFSAAISGPVQPPVAVPAHQSGLGIAAACRQLERDWGAWENGRPDIEKAIARAIAMNAIDSATEQLDAAISARDRLITRTVALFDQLAVIAVPLTADVLADARSWGLWLEQQRDRPAQADTQVALLRTQRGTLEQDLATARARGEALKAQREHLRAVTEFVSRHWPAERADECPTCGSPLRERYGQDIHERLAALSATSDASLQAARETYRIQAQGLKDLDAQLAALGMAGCPLSTERQVVVSDALAPLFPTGSIVSAVLADAGARDRWLAVAGRLVGRPAPPAAAESGPTARAAELCQRVASDIAEVRAVVDRAAGWAAVKKRCQTTLAGVMEDHLPETIGRVWYELTMVLTPARWQLPAVPRLHAEAQRGRQRMSVRLGAGAQSGYARHLLNGAEAHTLGLAWFLLRYLTAGRFRYALIAMDDPAQDMDQPAFRDLCRFWATLLRLHRINGLALVLLVFLHQDERALDAVRATDATLHRLGWNQRVPDWLRVLRLQVGPARYPAPVQALRPARAQVA